MRVFVNSVYAGARLRYVFLVFATLLLCLVAAADSAENALLPLTIDRAVKHALTVNNELQFLNDTAERMRAELHTARLWRDPELRMGYGEDSRRREDTGFSDENLPRDTRDTENYSLALRFFVPNPWEKRAEISARHALWMAAKAEAEAAAWRIEVRVGQLWHELDSAELQLQLNTERMILHERLAELTSVAVEKRHITRQEAAGRHRRRINAHSEMAVVRQRVVSLRAELAGLLEMSVVDLAAIREPPVFLAELPPSIDYWQVQKLVDAVSVARHDLLSHGWRTSAAAAGLRAAEASIRPWPAHVQAGFSRTRARWKDNAAEMASAQLPGLNNADTDASWLSKENGWSVGAAFVIPLGSVLKRAHERQRLEYRHAVEHQQRLVVAARIELRNAADEWLQLRELAVKQRASDDKLIAELRVLIDDIGDGQEFRQDERIGIELDLLEVRLRQVETIQRARAAFFRLLLTAGQYPVD